MLKNDSRKNFGACLDTVLGSNKQLSEKRGQHGDPTGILSLWRPCWLLFLAAERACKWDTANVEERLTNFASGRSDIRTVQTLALDSCDPSCIKRCRCTRRDKQTGKTKTKTCEGTLKKLRQLRNREQSTRHATLQQTSSRDFRGNDSCSYASGLPTKFRRQKTLERVALNENSFSTQNLRCTLLQMACCTLPKSC